MISEEQFRVMRSTQEQSMLSVAAIERRSLTSDGQGGQTAAYTTVANGVPCRLAQQSGHGRGTGSETRSADAIRAVTSWVLTVPHGTDLQQADRVRIAGNAYEVAILIRTDHATAVRARLSRS